jgi:hypothetical protein
VVTPSDWSNRCGRPVASRLVIAIGDQELGKSSRKRLQSIDSNTMSPPHDINGMAVHLPSA